MHLFFMAESMKGGSSCLMEGSMAGQNGNKSTSLFVFEISAFQALADHRQRGWITQVEGFAAKHSPSFFAPLLKKTPPPSIRTPQIDSLPIWPTDRRNGTNYSSK
jgi:hypothetical protein